MTIPYYGMFWFAPLTFTLLGLFVLGWILYRGESTVWIAVEGALILYGFGSPLWGWLLAGLVVLLGVPPVRQRTISTPLMRLVKAADLLPKISETERTALEAGDLWIERDLFSGRPDFDMILEQPISALSEEEQAFLDGPVEELCKRVDDWSVWSRRGLPDKAWDLIKEKRFFGLIVPEEYGGHDFSPSANSAVIQKLASHSQALAITVMVPNSLGPAELLMHYGTKQQKDYYLPRLARGEEIPCFALTEPQAGSDAGSIQAEGVVFEGEDGRRMLRLNWEKRYITLSSISTVLGLAFRLRDPENLLGRGEEDLGITCALIPTDTEGVVAEKRHDPLGVPFHNGPTEGRDVEVPIDVIIGGEEMAGKGWQMLMESLGVGRGVSLPASSAGSSKLAARVVSAHGRIRKQFGIPIGKFEGVEEPLARIGGFNYLMEAGRRFTCSALNQGKKPAVVTAMAKYSITELARRVINDAMDVRAGNAIQRGPRNLLAHSYIATPISITVEGANIMTRSLIIFGQGAIRCHPYLYDEVRSLMEGDGRRFDRALFGHVGHVIQNGVRAAVLSLTRGFLSGSLADKPTRRYVQKLSWVSASFAFLSDLALLSLGGALKRKEKLSGRFADVFRWLYLATATLRHYKHNGYPEDQRDVFDWSMEYALKRIQDAFEQLYTNLRIPGLSWVFRGPLLWWSRLNSLGHGPSDHRGHRVARSLIQDTELRRSLTEGLFEPEDPDRPLAQLERAFALVCRADRVARTLREAVKSGDISEGNTLLETAHRAREEGLITDDEFELLNRAQRARQEAIQVDDFSAEQFARHHKTTQEIQEQTGV